MRHPYPELSRAPETRLAVVERDIEKQPEIAGFQAYELFANDSEQQKAHFIAATEGNPKLTYPLLQGEGLARLEALIGASANTQDNLAAARPSAESVLVTLLGSEKNARADALFDAIEYRQGEMFMAYMAARMNDESLSEEDRAEAIEYYKLANEALYGVPENPVFSALTREHLMPHLEADLSNDDIAHQLQQEIRARIGEIHDEGFEFHKPSPESEERFAALVHEKFDGMVAHIIPRYDQEGNEIPYTAQEAVEVVRLALDYIGATKLGWRCEPVPNKSLMSVSAHRKLVEVGEDREPMMADELCAKVVHETGKHVLSSVIAARAGWLSAAYGQQGYLDLEESFATKLGNVYWGEAAVPTPKYRYIACGFAYGRDNHEPRDMRDCYEVVWRMIALDRCKEGAPIDEIQLQAAKNKAYLQCIRIYRSTSCDIPGLTFNMGLSYVNGDKIVNPIIDLIEDIDDLEFLLAGKTDPTRPDHLPINEAIKPDTKIATKLRERLASAA